jgi:hypothetical protein
LSEIDAGILARRIWGFCPDVEVVETNVDRFPFLRGIDAHYAKLTAADWAWVEAQEVQE